MCLNYWLSINSFRLYKMKRKYVVLLLFFFIFGNNWLFAQSIGIRVPDTTVVAGTFVDIPIYADNSLTGYDITAYTLQLSFDENSFQAVSVIVTGTVSAPFGVPLYNTSVPGRITIAGAGSSALNGAGKLLYIRFKVKQTGQTWINLTGPQYNFFNEGLPEIRLTNGIVNVMNPPSITVFPDYFELAKGEELQFYVNGGKAPFTWLVNDNLLATIDNNGKLRGLKSGLVRVIAVDSEGLRDTSGLITIKPFRISIPSDLSQWQGSYINVPIISTDLSSEDIFSGNITLRFDQNFLTPIGIIQVGTLMDNFPLPEININTPGVFNLAFAGTTNLSGAGTLVFVRFLVSNLNSGYSGIQFIKSHFNENILPSLTDGQIFVKQLPQLNIFPKSGNLLAGEKVQLTVVGNVNPPIIWQLNNTVTAVIDDTGLLTALQSGVVIVEATDSLGSKAFSEHFQIFDTKINMPHIITYPDTSDLFYPVFIESKEKIDNLISFQGTINFDINYLTFLDIETTGTLTQGWLIEKNISEGQIHFAGSANIPVDENGTFFKLIFEKNVNFKSGDNAPVYLNSLTLNEGYPLALLNRNGTVRMESLLVQEISLNAGWNIFSVGLQPQISQLAIVSQKLINNGSLVKIQDEGGNSLEDWGIYGSWQNNIGNISVTEGYKIKVKRNDTLEISGTPVEYPIPIPLKKGWNIAGYPQQTDFSGMNLVQQLADKGTLIKVQDEGGNSIEDWGIFGSWTNNIGNFMAGEGYKIKVSADDTLWIYENYPKSSVLLPEIIATSHFAPVFNGNGIDHMNINLVGLAVNILQVGDELAIFDGATCVGAVTLMPHHLRNQTASIVTSATDNQGMHGFVVGNPFVLKLWNSENKQEFKLEPEIVKGTSTFIRNETTVASLEKYATTGLDGLFASEQPEINCYPNPFSDEITVEINLFNETEVHVEVLNQLGQQVRYLAAGEQLNRGVHRLIWDGTNAGKSRVAPGIYLIRMKISDMVYYRKVVYSK